MDTNNMETHTSSGIDHKTTDKIETVFFSNYQKTRDDPTKYSKVMSKNKLITNIKKYFDTLNKGKITSFIIILLLILPFFITFLNPNYLQKSVLGVRNNQNTPGRLDFGSISSDLERWFGGNNTPNKYGLDAGYNPNAGIDDNTKINSDNTQKSIEDYTPKVKEFLGLPVPIKIKVTNQNEEAIGDTSTLINESYELSINNTATRIKNIKTNPSQTDYKFSINYEIAKRLKIPQVDGVYDVFMRE
jgi:hypothetical protein